MQFCLFTSKIIISETNLLNAPFIMQYVIQQEQFLGHNLLYVKRICLYIEK